MKADAVFEGGGIKGIAFIGAIARMEEEGYTWEKVAGTSAGSIVAALLAAGYTSAELYPIFQRLDYLSFLQRKGLHKIPYVGSILQLLTRKGLYDSDPIEKFIYHLLRKKRVQTFGDIAPEHLRIIASDITEGSMLVLPDSLESFGIDPASFPIARAVRMSSSIPYFFQPFVLAKEGQKHVIVDGGLLSNFPVWLFDVPGKPRWPTFGFRLSNALPKQEPAEIKGVVSFTKALITTMLDAHDRYYVSRAHAVRTIFIPTLDVRATQFHIPEQKRVELLASGREAASRFLSSWDFEKYIREFRSSL